MQSSSSDKLQKRLIESNIKTQEAASQVVKSVKELVTSLKEAGEVPEAELQIPKDINEKLDKLLQQNTEVATKLDELLNLLKSQQRPMEPPPQPSAWRKL